jgi:predicted lactoylglutathione lyase
LRIGTNRTTADDIVMTSWVHAKCFTLPKKIDSDSFLQTLDMSTLSDSQKEEVEQLIQNATPAGKRKAADSQDAGGKKIKVIPLDVNLIVDIYFFVTGG